MGLLEKKFWIYLKDHSRRSLSMSIGLLFKVIVLHVFPHVFQTSIYFLGCPINIEKFQIFTLLLNSLLWKNTFHLKIPWCKWLSGILNVKDNSSRMKLFEFSFIPLEFRVDLKLQRNSSFGEVFYQRPTVIISEKKAICARRRLLFPHM